MAPRKINPDNILAKVAPWSLDEWDYSKNDKSPFDYTYGQMIDVWWLCPDFGHSYIARINTRVIKGSKCPYCANRKLLVGFNDLGTKAPNLAKQLDPTLNNGVSATDVIYGSNSSVTWRCDKHRDHIWSAVVAIRYSREDKCPYCTNKKLLEGFNDLGTKVPHLAKQFHPTKNGDKRASDFLYGSNKSVWWQCDINSEHSWKTSITTRLLQNTGCPDCDNTGTSFPEQAILFYMKQVFPDAVGGVMVKGVQVDVYIPSKDIAIEYDGFIWHKDRTDNDAQKNWLLEDKLFIRIRENGLEELDSFGCINIFTDGKATDLDSVINSLLDTISSKGIAVKAIDVSVVRDRVEIKEKLYNRKVTNSLGEVFPSIAKHWDYTANGSITPYMVSRSSGELVNWVCAKCGFKWNTSVNQMTAIYKSGRCKYCKPTVSIVSKLTFKGDLLGLRFNIDGLFFDIAITGLKRKGIKLDISSTPKEELLLDKDGVYRTESELNGLRVFSGGKYSRAVNDIRKSHLNKATKVED